MSATHSGVFEVARDFAEHGFPVFPTHTVIDGRCSCGEGCGRNGGKHPRTRNGFKDATSDERELLAWNDRWPDANWAVACGERLSVIDIDSKNGADPSEVLAEYDLHARPISLTGEAPEGTPLAGVRGAHVYSLGGARTGGAKVPGVEIRGAGAYVMLPGSRHLSGVAYEWRDGDRPWSAELLPVPASLVPPQGSARAAAPPVEDDIPEHERNTTLTSLAGTMRRRGFHEDEIAAALLVTNANRCVPPLSEAEVRKIARSVSRYEPGKSGEKPRKGREDDPEETALLAAPSSPATVEVKDGTVFDQGSRHEQLLAWARSRYTAHGVLGEAAWLGMLGKNQVSCIPPLPEDEVRRLWRHLENSRIARRERSIGVMLARLEGV